MSTQVVNYNTLVTSISINIITLNYSNVLYHNIEHQVIYDSLALEISPV